jgi:hypothetical protein
MEFLIQLIQLTSGGTTIGTTVLLLIWLQIMKLENMLSPSTDLKIVVMETSIFNTKSTPTSVLPTIVLKELCAPQLNLDIMIPVTWTSQELMMNTLNSSKLLSKEPTFKMASVELTTQHPQLKTKICVHQETLNTSSGNSIST